MTLTLEQIITKILSEKPGLTREEIMKMIEEREKLAGGFLTRESAALSLAAELGVAIKPNFKYETLIKDLVSGLRDVTVTGRVIYVSQLEKFNRPDGRERVRRSIHIADKTGVAKVILWDDKAISSSPESLIDRIVRLSHLSVRRRAGGNLELRAGPRSTIEVDPTEAKSWDYPPLTLFIKRVGEIPQYKGSTINVLGLIEQVYPITTFKRQNGTEGKVRRIDLADNGKATLVLWDKNADLVSESHVGRYAIVFWVRVKERFDGRLELHSKDKTQIITIERIPSGL
ncbi:MAG: hypothetical protein QXR84_02795 [Candidatus Bathyarchaeia archaeon]|nr:hypothetical protein [Candidatus Bathyarchaeota archaeon]